MDKEKHPRRFPTICDRLWEKARSIGNGNASKGIREAIESYRKPEKKNGK